MGLLSMNGRLSGRKSSAVVGFHERERSSLFYKDAGAVQFLKAGSTFRRRRDNATVETARVLSVATDSFGIPHVRYEIEIRKNGAHAQFRDGPRVLALRSFIGAYRERVD
ncbi:MAG: hypothetical protein QNJ84_01570 [Alphaproteobacteria bacterium]|nr:hypothetical protein [Alphaproteobacteria bacterium]